jgi:hypothetical protein
MAEKNSFVFYRSFYESAKPLPDKEKLALYESIIQYALNQDETERQPMVNSFFCLIKPLLEANHKRFVNGKSGGRPKAGEKPKHNLDITETKPKHNLDVTEPEPYYNYNSNSNSNLDYNDIKKPKKYFFDPVYYKGLKERQIQSSWSLTAEEKTFMQEYEANQVKQMRGK